MQTTKLTNMVMRIIPQQYHKYFSVVKHHLFRGYSRAYYGQFAEDVLIESFSREKGFYVDIGAHNPYLDSNTHTLHKKGWTRINIDPLPEAIQLFKFARKKDTNLNIAIGPDQMLKYHMFVGPNFNTFNQDLATAREKQGLRKIGEKSIKCVPLHKVLARHAANREIDLMCIDVEGFEMPVLESNDWNRFSPKLIVIEDLEFSVNKLHNNPIHNFLTDKNYLLVARTTFNSFYKLQEGTS